MVARVLALVAVVALTAGPALARETEHFYSAKDAAESEQGQKYLLEVPFFLKGESHRAVGTPISEFSSTRTSSGAFRSDESACRSAFLAALKTMQERATKAGADAIVDVVSITDGTETESATNYRCVSGATVAHVGLKGQLVKYK